MDHSVLEQITSINCSSFSTSDNLPSHLEAWFRELESLSTIIPLIEKEYLAWISSKEAKRTSTMLQNGVKAGIEKLGVKSSIGVIDLVGVQTIDYLLHGASLESSSPDITRQLQLYVEEDDATSGLAAPKPNLDSYNATQNATFHKA
ncbi:hypothetical protein L1887_07863 [Cichorium endivia]|nr:hypothetical protein L1887_07863 [Cichorium endivia]